eukprot:TRINITY_DN9687_c0_g1_i1.p1 TRINITY_DN9687_c0_g1~~TRINITY_DN9687_c0_g1_i1.p1  ORF type:complete len:354 (-),score=82.72 TRINITY_DN9687_c0_g1_i1:32-1093(-)
MMISASKIALVAVLIAIAWMHVSMADRISPQFSEVMLGANTIDVRNAGKYLNVTVELTDDSLISHVSVIVLRSDGSIIPFSLKYESGDVWTNSLHIPRGVAPGFWTLAQIEAFDEYGNMNVITTDEFLETWPTGFEVLSILDEQAPAIEDFQFSSTLVYSNNLPFSMSVVLRVKDSTGFSFGRVSLFDPVGVENDLINSYKAFSVNDRKCGNEYDGLYQVNMTITKQIEGQWGFKVILEDVIYNDDTYNVDSISSNGFHSVFSLSGDSGTTIVSLKSIDQLCDSIVFDEIPSYSGTEGLQTDHEQTADTNSDVVIVDKTTSQEGEYTYAEDRPEESSSSVVAFMAFVLLVALW